MTIDAAWLKSELAAARFALREVKRKQDPGPEELWGAKNRIAHLLSMRPAPPRRPHARDVSDREFLLAVRAQCDAPGNASRWCTRWFLRFPAYSSRPVPEQQKLVRAKARRVIDRGLMRGCVCGCRGDFELTREGAKFLASDNSR